jgi:hypothetical protein
MSHVRGSVGVLSLADPCQAWPAGELVSALSTSSQIRLFSSTTPRAADESDCMGLLYRRFYCAQCGTKRDVQIVCGDRCCPTCRRRAFKRVLSAWSHRVDCVSLSRLALVTLTMLIRPQADLRARVGDIRRAFGRLVRRKAFAAVVDGGIYSIECKLTKRNMWNVHLHALVSSRADIARWHGRDGRLRADLRGCGGEIMRPRDLSKLWRSITKDSYIVDIVPVRDTRGALTEIVKYINKGTGLPAGSARETYNAALRGARLIQSFGSWHPTSDEYGLDDLEAPGKRAFVCTCGSVHWLSEFDLARMSSISGFPRPRLVSLDGAS